MVHKVHKVHKRRDPAQIGAGGRGDGAFWRVLAYFQGLGPLHSSGVQWGRAPVKQDGNRTSQLVIQAESRRGDVAVQRKNNVGAPG